MTIIGRVLWHFRFWGPHNEFSQKPGFTSRKSELTTHRQGVWTSGMSLLMLMSVRRVRLISGTVYCSIARRVFEGLPVKTRLLSGELHGSPSFSVPFSILSFPPEICLDIQASDLRKLSICCHDSEVWCGCLGTLAKITFWHCDCCVNCPQKQSIVKVVTKETWKKRFGFAKGMRKWEERNRGQNEGVGEWVVEEIVWLLCKGFWS